MQPFISSILVQLALSPLAIKDASDGSIPIRWSELDSLAPRLPLAARGANMATRFSNESTGVNTGEFGESQTQTRDTRRKIRNRRMRGLLVAATMVSVILPSTGCMFISGVQRSMSRNEALDEFMVNYRNRAWAARAWLCRKNRFANHCYPADLEAGFRQGYEDTAAGGTGCLPAVCPQSYWGWQYQSADGQSRMNAWFEGYPLGVQAAEQDGVGHWGNVGTAFPNQPPAAAAPVATAEPIATGAAATGADATDADIEAEELTPPAPVPSSTEAVKPLINPSRGMVFPPVVTQPVDALTTPVVPGL